MSARHLPNLRSHVGNKTFRTVLFVALAMNQSHQDPLATHNLRESNDTGVPSSHPRDVNVPLDGGATSPTQPKLTNSVDLIHGIEDGQDTLAFVPLILHPDSVTDEVKMDELQSVMDAIRIGLSCRHLQQHIDKSFPKNDFSKHLCTYLRTLLADKASFKALMHSQNVSNNRTINRLAQSAFRWIPLCSQSASLTQSSEIYGDEKTIAFKQVKNMQRWFAGHFLPIGQMAQMSMLVGKQMKGFDREGYPMVNMEIYPYDQFSRDEIKELYKLSNYFNFVRDDLVQKARALKARLNPEIRRQWRAHAKWVGLANDKEFQTADRLINAIIWMLAHAPPKFFVNHRSDFAELADLLTKNISKIEGPSSEILGSLSFMGRAMKDMRLKAEDMAPLRKACVALMSHAYWDTPNAPL
eukprot:Blabericola_migrator_1__8492@NODE_442_length_8428_cov_40_654228_g347_i0_p1_GENE_NODE_442_length_8428_cov_40_654228_g347_i0NODE_442_length_8428_cov_40_654228_g347_i0_p1_ORF_typecomplete_len411_score60_45_NODE_442_length_8428_cov_40_654228_g347_i028584090